jgi:hypothetical protein
MTAISGVSAASYDTSKINDAYSKVVEYYKNNNTLNNADKILAVESLGLEAESNQFDISSVDFSKTSLSKKIVTEVLLGIDPTEDKETLESQIDENGNVEGSWGASSDIWTLYALYATSSEKTNLLADKLNTDLASSSVCGYEWGGVYYADYDTTGWVIEGLAVVNKEKYATTINKAIDYIKSNTTVKTTGWITTDNVDTQSQVLEGMFAYDANALLNDNYTIHPVDCLLNTQLSDGSFPSSYNAEYTTAEVAKTLGTYKNGSVIIKAKKAYKILNPEEPDNKQPTNANSTVQSTQPTENSNKKSTSVKTGDETNIVIFVSLSMVSGGLFLVLRKEYERVH